MGRVRNLRLPDGMEDVVDRYLSENGIKFTDLVIAGINRQVYPQIKQPLVELPVTVTPVERVKPLLEKAIEKKVSSGVFFNPCPKKGGE